MQPELELFAQQVRIKVQVSGHILLASFGFLQSVQDTLITFHDGHLLPLSF